MSYQNNYITKKTEYLELKNNQMGGDIDFKNSINIYKKVIDLSKHLEQIYDNFWKNIYYNDAYVFYKNAIEYYKNIQNSKFHDFFSGIINKKLYTGSCQYINEKSRTEFSCCNEKIKKIDLDDLCNLSVQVINILDTVFMNCPNIPYNLIVYRHETRNDNDNFFSLKKGDYYKNLGYISTSINPWYLFLKDLYSKKNKINIVMTLYIPHNAKGYYMSHPFGIYYDSSINKNIGLQEYEILLARNNIFEVLETKKIDNYFFIKLIMRHHMIPKLHIESIETKDVPQSYFTKNEYKKINKRDYVELYTNIKDFEKDNVKINIYKSYKLLNKNKKLFDDYQLFYDQMCMINNIDIQEWLNKKPKYNKKKYNSIFEDDFDIVYTKFMNYIPLMKKKKNIYINLSIIYKINNELYINIIKNLDTKKNINIKNPLFIDESLTNSVFSYASSFITVGEDKNMLMTNKVDTRYPIIIIIKYISICKYIPLFSDIGFTFNINELKIEKVNKIYITGDVFYYFIEAS